MPLDPNDPGFPVERNASRVTSPVKSGQYSVGLYIDGRQDDSTVCGTRKVNGEKIGQIQFEVSFEFYSEDESFNVLTSVVGFGTSNPEVEADFADFGQANEVADENVTPILQV